MRFDLLGPLAVTRQGQQVPLGATKPRLLLAALLLHCNEVVPHGRLIDAVWDGVPPASAHANLRTYVRGLRRVLGQEDGERLCLSPGGYLLRVHPLERDLDRFTAAADQGREALARGEPAAAQEGFRRALSVPRGSAPLADLPLTAALARAVAPVSDLWLAVEEDHAGALLAVGSAAEAVRRLRPLADRHPLRERTWALLMLALYRLGDVAGALDAFRRAREALRQELGLDPGPELAALHDDVLHHRPHLAHSPAPATGTDAAPAQDGGPEPEAAAPRTAAGLPPRQLPPRLEDFRGREQEVARLDLLLGAGAAAPGANPLCTVSGMAGVGKTSLALHWAHRVADRFPDGQLYMDLRGYDPGHALPPAEVLRCFLEALGVPTPRMPLGLEGRSGLYRSLLSDARMLVVLDNARDSAQVRPLLPGSGDCAVVVTSRDRLTDLAVREGSRQLVLDVLPPDDARDVLASRVGAERLAGEPAAADGIIAATGRLPLALAIVGARISAHEDFPLRVFEKELGAAGPLGALGDGQVRQVFSWSYLALGAHAARLFRLLGLHPGPDLTAEAAAALAGVPLPEVFPALRELTRLHLLSEHAPGRFAFHDLLKAYATELSDQLGKEYDRRAARHRLFDHYLAQAHPAALLLQPQWLSFAPADPPPGSAAVPPPGDPDAAAEWFAAEQHVLARMVREAGATGFAAYAWQLAASLTAYLAPRGLWQQQEATQRVALRAAEEASDQVGRATALRLLARACTRLGELQAAEELLGRAREVYRELGAPDGEAQALHNTLEVRLLRGQLDEAIAVGGEALELHRKAGNHAGEARTLNAVGWVHATAGDFPQALARCSGALARQRLLGDRNGQAATLDSLGYIHHRLGEHDQAIACFEEAIRLFRASADRYHEAETLLRLGDARLDREESEAARADWHTAAAILDELGDPAAEAAHARLARLP